jgi:hypothetical protein
MLPERRTGAMLGDMQLRSDLLNADTATRGLEVSRAASCRMSLSSVRSETALRPERRNHVWSYDFVEDRTHGGRKYRVLSVLNEFTHECLAIRVARKLKAIDVIDVLSDLFFLRGITSGPTTDRGSSVATSPCR